MRLYKLEFFILAVIAIFLMAKCSTVPTVIGKEHRPERIEIRVTHNGDMRNAKAKEYYCPETWAILLDNRKKVYVDETEYNIFIIGEKIPKWFSGIHPGVYIVQYK